VGITKEREETEKEESTMYRKVNIRVVLQFGYALSVVTAQYLQFSGDVR
jgi:glucose uptake protein GlcU